jgi:FkbM family methyltransferase
MDEAKCRPTDIITVQGRLFAPVESPSQCGPCFECPFSAPIQCKKLYLDVGSNVGVQIRKLFEPAKFPNAPVLPIFDQYFGPHSQRQHVCAVGFEPNPAHQTGLQQMARTYSSHGWPTVVYPHAASNVWGNTLTFFNDPMSFNNVGSSQFDWTKEKGAKSTSTNVKTVDLADFVKRAIAHYQPEQVIMKLDIEGAEFGMYVGKNVCLDGCDAVYARVIA